MYEAHVEAEHIVQYNSYSSDYISDYSNLRPWSVRVPWHPNGVVFTYLVIYQELLKHYGVLPSFSLAPPGVEHLSKERNG